MSERTAYKSLSGIPDGSNLRRDLTDHLLDIGGSASVAITCLDERDFEGLDLAIRDVLDAVRDLPRMHSRVCQWERAFGRAR